MTENNSSASDAGITADSKPPAKKVPVRRRRRNNKSWDITQFKVEPQEGKLRFHDFSLPVQLMRAVQDSGFEYCTPIQAASLPYSLHGHDVVGKAQTGTGKTAAFLTNIIADLIKHPVSEQYYVGEARSLILAPTRELAIQIGDDAKALLKHTKLNVHTLVGGMDYAKQLSGLQKKHCDILVGTPGRLLDFANNRDIHLDRVEVLVIDEADRMLDMGFIPQVRRLVNLTPKRDDRQTMLFSATFTPEVLRLANNWTDKPVTIEIAAERVATDSVEQQILITTGKEKFTVLNNILRGDDVESAMVFANRRDICRTLQEKLKKQGFKVGLLSGDVPQNRRMRTLDSFKSGKLKVMVATDVAGRGIHVDGVSHVVNYTLPEEPEDYVHRIGRTGRAGKTGTSISFACEDDAFLLEPIEKLLDIKLPCTLPDERLVKDIDVSKKQIDEAKRKQVNPEELKSDKPKAEESKAEESKVEESKVEEPKAEEPKAEDPKAEEPKAEEPKAEEPKAEEPKAEEPKAEEPKAEEPKAEEPKAEEPKAEEPKAD